MKHTSVNVCLFNNSEYFLYRRFRVMLRMRHVLMWNKALRFSLFYFSFETWLIRKSSVFFSKYDFKI